MKDVFAQTPEKVYEIKEHIAYCFNCISKTLELNQQICLLLKEIYAFKVSEIVEITGLTEGIVKHAIADARKNMIRIFDNRCSFVNKNGVCHQCTVLKGNLNPKHDAHIEAMKIKMVKEGNYKPCTVSRCLWAAEQKNGRIYYPKTFHLQDLLIRPGENRNLLNSTEDFSL